MVDVVTSQNKWLYTDLLEEMFRMRYEVAVEQLGWQLPIGAPGIDKDAFDTKDTIYLIETDEQRSTVYGCTRLNPTTKPCLMTEVFPEACDLQDIPSSNRVWECSRFLIDRKRCGAKERNTLTRQRLGIAMSEYCIANGITHIIWLTYQMFYNNILGVYDTEPLGRPRFYEDDGATYIPAISSVDYFALARQREKLIQQQDCITFVYQPLQLPDDLDAAAQVA